MINSIEDLCDKALEYLLSIKIGNKNKEYIPSGTLNTNNNLKTYSRTITYPSYNTTNNMTATFVTKTNEVIPVNFRNSVTNDKIINDWNSYVKEYFYPKVSKDKHISVSSMFMFLYYFRYFVDKKFCMFTDVYSLSSVWLYNTENVNYTPNVVIVDEDKVLNVSDMNSYMNTLIDEITTRDTIKVLKASTSCNSCSSSSSSSSSSCSSVFIVYFNLGL